MHEELIDIYNENMEKIGSARKKDAHSLGLWHKSIHCWLFIKSNNKNYVIIQKRSDKKVLMPNFYDVSVAGHYDLNEDKQDGFREVNEELGVIVSNFDWHYLGVKFDIARSMNTVNKEFCEVYFAEIKTDIDKFSLSQREVDAVVKVLVEDGLALFSGATQEILASGIKWDENRSKLVESEFKIHSEEFIPRIDNYYAKIFAIADLYFKGYKYLYI